MQDITVNFTTVEFNQFPIPRYKEAVDAVEVVSAECEDLRARLAATEEEAAELRLKVEESSASVDYRAKYEELSAMVAPFKEQLEQFELEKAALESQNKAKDSDLKKLAAQFGQAIGHQNHKQKIHHMVQIKEENVALK